MPTARNFRDDGMMTYSSAIRIIMYTASEQDGERFAEGDFLCRCVTVQLIKRLILCELKQVPILRLYGWLLGTYIDLPLLLTYHRACSVYLL